MLSTWARDDDAAPGQLPVRVLRWREEAEPTRAELEEQLRDEGLVPWITRDDAGTAYDEHDHAHDEVRVVVKGALRFEVGDRSFLLGPGDRVELAAGTPHAADVVGDEGAEYLCATLEDADG